MKMKEEQQGEEEEEASFAPCLGFEGKVIFLCER